MRFICRRPGRRKTATCAAAGQSSRVGRAQIGAGPRCRRDVTRARDRKRREHTSRATTTVRHPRDKATPKPEPTRSRSLPRRPSSRCPDRTVYICVARPAAAVLRSRALGPLISPLRSLIIRTRARAPRDRRHGNRGRAERAE